jgi:hypothetical protein
MANFQEGVAARAHSFDRGSNLGELFPHNSPVIGTQHQQGDAAARHVLLLTDFLIGRDEKIEIRLFCGRQQSPVLQTGPSLKACSDDGVAGVDQEPQFLGRTLIQDNLHAARVGSAGETALLAAKSRTAWT